MSRAADTPWTAAASWSRRRLRGDLLEVGKYFLGQERFHVCINGRFCGQFFVAEHGMRWAEIMAGGNPR